MFLKVASLRLCVAAMSEVALRTEDMVENGGKMVDKDEDFDKDSGNHSGEEAETETRWAVIGGELVT